MHQNTWQAEKVTGRKGGIVKKGRRGGRQKSWQAEKVALGKKFTRIRDWQKSGRQKRWHCAKIAEKVALGKKNAPEYVAAEKVAGR